MNSPMAEEMSWFETAFVCLALLAMALCALMMGIKPRTILLVTGSLLATTIFAASGFDYNTEVVSGWVHKYYEAVLGVAAALAIAILATIFRYKYAKEESEALEASS
jgi:hypothetical protein